MGAKIIFRGLSDPLEQLVCPFHDYFISGQSAIVMFGEPVLTGSELAALGKSELHQAHTQHLEFFRSLISITSVSEKSPHRTSIA
jgi:hypothetical protein